MWINSVEGKEDEENLWYPVEHDVVVYTHAIESSWSNVPQLHLKSNLGNYSNVHTHISTISVKGLVHMYFGTIMGKSHWTWPWSTKAIYT